MGANASRIQAKNGLENYCYSMENTMNDEKLKGKVSEEDKATIMGKVEETIKWLDANQEARKKNTKQNKKNWKKYATQSCKRCTPKVVHQAVCQAVCQVVCQAVCQVVCQAVSQVQVHNKRHNKAHQWKKMMVQKSKKLTNIFFI